MVHAITDGGLVFKKGTEALFDFDRSGGGGGVRRYNAVVTPLRKAASYEPRITILGIWGDTWLTWLYAKM